MRTLSVLRTESATSFAKLTSEEMEVEVSSSCTGLFNQATSDTTDLLADNMVEVVLL